MQACPTVALLSDIHANREALEAVLRDLEEQKPDRIVVLGDTVGYGPEPVACFDTISRLADVLLIGNHELDGIDPPRDLEISPDALEMIDWTHIELEESEAWGLLAEQIVRQGDALAQHREPGRFFIHAGPARPTAQYIRPHKGRTTQESDTKLLSILEAFGDVHGFCGHTHVPAVLLRHAHRDILPTAGAFNRKHSFIGEETQFFVPMGDTEITDLSGRACVINPGSVGQPRDGDARASYALYDGERVCFRRVDYDYHPTQAKLRALEALTPALRERQAMRLAVGR